MGWKEDHAAMLGEVTLHDGPGFRMYVLYGYTYTIDTNRYLRRGQTGQEKLWTSRTNERRMEFYRRRNPK